MMAAKTTKKLSAAEPRPKGRAGCPQPAARRDEDIAPYLKNLRSPANVTQSASSEDKRIFFRVYSRDWRMNDPILQNHDNSNTRYPSNSRRNHENRGDTTPPH